MEIDEDMEYQIQKQLSDKLELSKGVYVGDIDDLMKTIEHQMPMVDHEQIYLWELEKQGRVYLTLMFIGGLMLILGALL